MRKSLTTPVPRSEAVVGSLHEIQSISRERRSNGRRTDANYNRATIGGAGVTSNTGDPSEWLFLTRVERKRSK